MLIPIGQFSKMTQLSLKALRLYDQMGLLRPAYVDPSSGYRHYRLDQAGRAELIRSLRSMEMPLESIRAVLESRNSADFRSRLLEHRTVLIDRLESLEKNLNYLDSMLNSEHPLQPYAVSMTDSHACLIAGVKKRTNLKAMQQHVPEAFMLLKKGLDQAKAVPVGPPFILYHYPVDAESEGDIEICAPVRDPFPDTAGVVGREQEGGPVAATEHHGPYQELAGAYHAITAYISGNGYEIAGPPREIYMSDPRMVPAAELITRLEFPVCPQ